MALEPLVKYYFEVLLEDGKYAAVSIQEPCSFKANRFPTKTGRLYFHTGNVTVHFKRKHKPQFECLQAKRIQGESANQRGFKSILTSATVMLKRKL